MASLEEALHDPHFVERGLFAHQVAGASGKTMPALPVPIAATLREAPGPRPSPKLGADNDLLDSPLVPAKAGTQGQELDSRLRGNERQRVQRFPAHQPRLRGGLHALAHHGAAQRRDPVEQIEAEAARALHGQEIRQQAAIERIDRERARRHVGAAHPVVARQQFRRRRHRPPSRRASTTSSPIVAASRRPRLSPCAPIGGMTCAASPTSAMRRAAKLRAVSTPSGKQPAARLDRDLAEDRMGAALDLGGKRARIERAEVLGLGRIDHADQARAQAGQGHQRERPGLGVELGRRCRCAAGYGRRLSVSAACG